MKKKLLFIFALILSLSLLSGLLSGCVGLSSEAPDYISDGNTIYKTGFYGSLFPNEYEYSGESIEIKSDTLNRIKNDKFSLYHANIGSYTEGTIYCLESDYENALAYYNNPDNYSYHCNIGVDSDTQVIETMNLEDVEVDKFHAFLEFAENNTYDPFNKKHNAKIETIILPMPDHSSKIVFYKKSDDSLFISTTGNECYIIDDHLYLVYQYDFGHGEYENLIAVKVSDEISNYFVEYMNSLL